MTLHCFPWPQNANVVKVFFVDKVVLWIIQLTGWVSMHLLTPSVFSTDISCQRSTDQSCNSNKQYYIDESRHADISSIHTSSCYDNPRLNDVPDPLWFYFWINQNILASGGRNQLTGLIYLQWTKPKCHSFCCSAGKLTQLKLHQHHKGKGTDVKTNMWGWSYEMCGKETGLCPHILREKGCLLWSLSAPRRNERCTLTSRPQVG